VLLQNVDARFMVCNGGALPERRGRTDSRLYHMRLNQEETFIEKSARLFYRRTSPGMAHGAHIPQWSGQWTILN
jgi:hypothetical protein